MADKIMMTAAAGAILLAATAVASAQQRAIPQDRYHGGYGYYECPTYGQNDYPVPPPLVPGSNDDASASCYNNLWNPGPYYSLWNNWTNEHGWNRWNVGD